MSPCERYEMLISSWLDGELGDDGRSNPGRLEMTDHLVRCAACREFYREARALDGLVASVAPGSQPAPAHVWERIREAARREEARPAVRTWLARPPAWATRLAAALALLVGATVLLWGNGGDRGGLRVGDAAPSEIEVRLGEGEMSEARFVELATEVLRADPRFHAAMYEVMQQVVEDTRPGEISRGETERAVENGAEGEGRRRATRDLV